MLKLTVALTSLALALMLSACVMQGSGEFDPEAAGASHLQIHLDNSRILHAYSTGQPDQQRIIFVHGTPGSATAWERYLATPPAESLSIAIDRLGFGRSMGGAVPSLADQADSIASLIPDAPQPTAVLVGHSLGGPIVVRAAADYPDRIAAIVIVAGSLDPDLEHINPLQYLAEIWPLTAILPTWAVTSNRELLALEDELKALEPLLKDIRIPVAIVHGTNDDLVPYANVPYMIDHLKNARVRLFTIEGGNHFLPWNAEDTVREAIAWVRGEVAADEANSGP